MKITDAMQLLCCSGGLCKMLPTRWTSPTLLSQALRIPIIYKVRLVSVSREWIYWLPACLLMWISRPPCRC